MRGLKPTPTIYRAHKLVRGVKLHYRRNKFDTIRDMGSHYLPSALSHTKPQPQKLKGVYGEILINYISKLYQINIFRDSMWQKLYRFAYKTIKIFYWDLKRESIHHDIGKSNMQVEFTMWDNVLIRILGIHTNKLCHLVKLVHLIICVILLGYLLVYLSFTTRKDGFTNGHHFRRLLGISKVSWITADENSIGNIT